MDGLTRPCTRARLSVVPLKSPIDGRLSAAAKKQGTREQKSAHVSFIAGRKDRCRTVSIDFALTVSYSHIPEKRLDFFKDSLIIAEELFG
jgi:hypothetical protein